MRHEHMVSRTRLFLDLFACVLQEFVFTVLRTVELYSVCACFVRGRFTFSYFRNVFTRRFTVHFNESDDGENGAPSAAFRRTRVGPAWSSVGAGHGPPMGLSEGHVRACAESHDKAGACRSCTQRQLLTEDKTLKKHPNWEILMSVIKEAVTVAGHTAHRRVTQLTRLRVHVP